MSDFRIDKITNRDGSAGTQIAGISTFSGTSGMQIPVGPTEYRGGRGRGVIMGGGTPAVTNICEYITIATTGNATDFGDTTVTRATNGGAASATRSFSLGGNTPSASSVVDYITTSSLGGANDFGDLTLARMYPAGVSDSTRAIANGGSTPVANDIIDYITMASTGGASDFGDLIEPTTYLTGAGCQSPTRGFVWGGHPQNSPMIQFYEIQSKGNAVEFGEQTVGKDGVSCGSNTTRGVSYGGSVQPANTGTDTIDYITMSTRGNATDFGDATSPNTRWIGAGMYSATRGVHHGGYPAINTLAYISIVSKGNAADFGDATAARGSFAGSSDSHGGLG